jgi:hypothetical protein
MLEQIYQLQLRIVFIRSVAKLQHCDCRTIVVIINRPVYELFKMAKIFLPPQTLIPQLTTESYIEDMKCITRF